MKKAFEEIFVDVTRLGTKIPTSKYSDVGKYIIVDQSQNQIAGYTDNEEGIFNDLPVIIFGDHTRVIKYVDKPFFLGADGTKILKSKLKNVNYKYLFYALQNAKIPNTGYNRHFKWLKSIKVNYPSASSQSSTVMQLEKISHIIECKKKKRDLLDDLVKARFVEMFGVPRNNPFEYIKLPLKDTCKLITGNTPSRNVAEYYGNYIEWIKTDNIVSGLLNPTKSAEYLSKEGMKIGRIVGKDSILMACIAGSIDSIGRVCVADRAVTFNQQINAIVPAKYNVLFLYAMLQLSKDYLVEDVNMSLKGILSKSKLAEKEFIVPPMELQNQFADFVKQVYKSKAVIEKSLEELETLQASLMQEYFS